MSYRRGDARGSPGTLQLRKAPKAKRVARPKAASAGGRRRAGGRRPCAEGSYRDPKTGRCRKLATPKLGRVALGGADPKLKRSKLLTGALAALGVGRKGGAAAAVAKLSTRKLGTIARAATKAGARRAASAVLGRTAAAALGAPVSVGLVAFEVTRALQNLKVSRRAKLQEKAAKVSDAYRKARVKIEKQQGFPLTPEQFEAAREQYLEMLDQLGLDPSTIGKALKGPGYVPKTRDRSR